MIQGFSLAVSRCWLVQTYLFTPSLSMRLKLHLNPMVEQLRRVHSYINSNFAWINHRVLGWIFRQDWCSSLPGTGAASMEIHRRKGPSPTVWECPWQIVTRDVTPFWWGCFGPFLGTLQNHSEEFYIILIYSDKLRWGRLHSIYIYIYNSDNSDNLRWT